MADAGQPGIAPVQKSGSRKFHEIGNDKRANGHEIVKGSCFSSTANGGRSQGEKQTQKGSEDGPNAGVFKRQLMGLTPGRR